MDSPQILTALVLILAHQLRDETPTVGAPPPREGFIDQAIDAIKQNQASIIERLGRLA